MFEQLEDGRIRLTLTQDDYNRLIFTLGYKLGELLKDGEAKDGLSVESQLRFMNRLNEGNPRYRPYQVAP